MANNKPICYAGKSDLQISIYKGIFITTMALIPLVFMVVGAALRKSGKLPLLEGVVVTIAWASLSITVIDNKKPHPHATTLILSGAIITVVYSVIMCFLMYAFSSTWVWVQLIKSNAEMMFVIYRVMIIGLTLALLIGLLGVLLTPVLRVVVKTMKMIFGMCFMGVIFWLGAVSTQRSLKEQNSQTKNKRQ